MRDSARKAFIQFSKPLEAWVSFPYLDVKGLLTVGMGNLIEPISNPDTLALPWTILFLRPALANEIREGLVNVKSRTDLCKKGGGAFADVSPLRLRDDAIEALIDKRITVDETNLRKYFPKYDEWPADAQLGLMSLAWAMGPDFDQHDAWPAFTKAVDADKPDWLTAAAQSHVWNANADRNAATHECFVNAAVSEADDMNPDILIWPARLSPDSPSAA